ncbi:MAG: hypothetical protein AB7N76_22135 [Planctomycetota bacterium]
MTRPALAPWLLLLLACALPARAQDAPPQEAPAQEAPPLRLAVGAGLTGSWTGAGWVACEALIDNTASPTGGAAELVLEVVRDGEPRWTCRRRVQLPARGRRREWFEAPLHEGTVTLRLEAWTLDAAGQPERRLAATSRPVAVTPREVDRGGRTALFLSGRQNPVADANKLLTGSANYGQPLRVEHRAADELPREPYGLRGLNLVVLHEVDLSRTSAEQRQVLLDWVERGGDVLLVPGRREGWFQSPGIRELVGGEVEAFHVDRLPRIERALGSRLVPPGQPREELAAYSLPGAEQLEPPVSRAALSLEERRRYGHTYSLLQKRRRGRGAVFLLAMDLTAPPFDRWRGTDTLIDLIGQTLEDSATRGRRAQPLFQRPAPCERPALGDLLDSNQRPSTPLIVGLILLYLVCVGPLNVHLLRKRSPVVLALAVPAVALGFTLLTIVGGFVTKGLGTVVWRVSVTTATPGATRGLEQTALSLRSSVADQHALRFQPGLRATRVFRGPEALATAHQGLRDDEGFSFGGVRLDTWEQGVFEANGELGLGKGLSLTAQGDELLVQNGTGHALEGLVVLDERDVLRRAGRLADGAEAATELHEAIRREGAAGREAVARALFQDPVAARLAAEALGEYVGRDLPAGRVVVARLRRAPSRITVDGDEDADREVALLVLTPTPLELAPPALPRSQQRRPGWRR